MTTSTFESIAAVAHERENLQNLFRQTPEMVCVLEGPEHRFVFVNPAHVRVLGFDATGKTVREAQPESVEIHGILDDVYRTGKTAELFEIPVTVTNRLRFFNLTYAARYNADHKIDGVMVLGAEITEEVLNREALKLQGKALELAMSDAPLTEILDVMTKLVETQAGGDLIASVLLADKERKHLLHGSAPGLPDEYNKIVHGIRIDNNVGSCGTAAFLKEKVVVSDIATDPMWADYRDIAARFGLHACWSTPILSSRNQLLGTFAFYSRATRVPTAREQEIVSVAAKTTALIIERRTESEEKARVQRDLSLVVELAQVGFWRIDLPSQKLKFSSRGQKAFGFADRKELTMTHALDALHPDDRQRVLNEVTACIEGRQPYRTEYRVIWPNGDIRWIEARGTTAYDEAGQPYEFTGSLVDITERMESKVALENARDDALRANELKSAFLANMSHEIRTPLGAMIGFADLLSDPSISLSERSNYIDILQKNGAQLGHVINDILDLSKVETGNVSFEYMKIKPVSIAHEVVSLMGVLAKEKGLALSLIDDKTCPETIISDPTRVKQVLINLVNNALKFTKVGSIEISISGFDGKDGERCCAFEVKDTGIGIAPQAQERLFKIFSQADDSMTRRFGGTGLGLALSRALARQMGGDVRLAKSIVDGGSTFHFAIESREELRDSLASQELSLAAAELVPLERNALEGVRVLLVEDSPDNQQLIWRYLSKYGARIEIADNGAEGVSQALMSDHDVVLMDLQMPVMDGYTAVGKLRARGYRTPIIALTAHAMSDVKKKCEDVGCNTHLPKPINSRELVETIRSVVRVF